MWKKELRGQDKTVLFNDCSTSLTCVTYISWTRYKTAQPTMYNTSFVDKFNKFSKI